MAKIAVWIFVVAGILIPLLLSVMSISIISKSSLPDRYSRAQELGGDPVLHDSYFYIEFMGQKIGMNPSILPPLSILFGIALIILGVYLMLHVNTGMPWN